eukprot:jgi/Tetstr1/455174/TSEL_042024.t1
MAASKGSAELKEREQELLMRLEQHVNTMTDNFIFVVKAARINEDDDKPEGDKKVPGEIPEVLAEKIILGGKGLLELVSELKRKAIVSDYAAVNRMKAERSLAFDQEVSRAEAELADVKAGAMACLAHLEQHYYASKHKPPVSMSKHKDADMQPLFNLALDLGDA